MDADPEDRLRSRLHSELGDGPAPRTRWSDVRDRGIDRARHGRRRRRLELVGGTATVVAVVLIVVVVASTKRSPVRVRTGPGPTVVTSTTSAPPTPVTAAVPPTVPVASTLDLGTSEVTGLVATGTAAWAALWGTGRLEYADDGRKLMLRSVPMGTARSGPLSIADGGGRLWAIDFSKNDLVAIENDDRVAIDGAPLVQRRRHLPAEGERVGYGNGKVWVTVCCDAPADPVHGNQRLLGIDPATLAVTSTLALPGDGESEEVAVNADGTYVKGEDMPTLVHVDPTGHRIVAQPEVGTAFCAVLLADPVVRCFQNQASSGRMVTIDAHDHATTIATPAPVHAATTFRGRLLVATALDLYELDGTHWRVIGRHPDITELAASGDALWAVQGNQLQRLAVP